VWSNPKSVFYHNEIIWKAIDGSLNHWLEKKYKNPNWWHNEIGVPQYMRDIIVLLKGNLSATTLAEAMKVLAQLRVQESGAGANLTWSADLGFHYGALNNDKLLMEKCRELLLKEIRISTEEGLQPDFSFHQHGKRLQTYHYGQAFLWENVRLAWQFRGTPYAFAEDKINILTGFVLNGWQWMGRGIHTVPGTMDRSASRIGALQGADIRKLVPYLVELSTGESKAFEKMTAVQNQKSSLEGYRYYPYSDFTAYHQKDFSFFLKTISNRTLPTESINNENLKGFLLNSGDTYLIKDGTEYFNLMPVWDWHHLPGVTAYESAFRINRNSFCGSVSNGQSGLTAMKYIMENKKRSETLSAHKFWASHGDLTVCLIADLSSQNINTPVYTTLDQSRLMGKVTVNNSGNVLKVGTYQLNNVKWIHHANFAYIPLSASNINLKIGKVSGTWNSINKSLSSDTVVDQIFMPVLQHDMSGVKSTGYVLGYSKTASHAKRMVKHPTWEVLRNDKDIQAVRFKDGTVMAAFFSSGSAKIGNDKLSVDQPCLLMISGNEILASNPAHSAMDIGVEWKGKTYKMKLKEDGSTTAMQF
ncbi:MAG TPA: polysaccharide lyase family 8 super-sandwich domain-containing protein, partial [Sphingobacteriaceae bacterium]